MCGLSAVTSISERCTSSAMRSRLGSMPRAQCSSKLRTPSASRRTLCRKLWMISGLNTFSSKLPDAPPMLIATSLPITCAAQHRHRLALGRVDLARHDRAARLVLGDADLAEPRARARGQPAHVVGDLHQRRRQRLERAVREDQRVVPGERLELVGRGDERQAEPRRQLGGDARTELRMRIQAGADRGAAEGQLAEVRQRSAHVRAARGRAARPSPRSPGRASAASRPAGGCGRS